MQRVIFALLSLLLFSGTPLSGAQAKQPTAAQGTAVDIGQTVVRMPLAEGVSMDDAVDSMKLRANQLNMMLVSEQPLYKQVRAMGQESRRMEIFQFCDPLTAIKMVAYNMDFAAYMPCRIALVEDKDGRGWLVMMNLDMFIEGASLSPELKQLAIDVRDKLNEIMKAGANAEL
jgi:uncharacterized protein (DUF302 family)